MSIAQISLGLLFFSTILIVWGIVKLHTYPGKVAEARGHPQRQAIEVTSLLGLLIFPLWMAALVWAYSGAIIGTLYVADEGGGADGDDGVDANGPIEATRPVGAAAPNAAPAVAGSGAGVERRGTGDGRPDDPVVEPEPKTAGDPTSAGDGMETDPADRDTDHSNNSKRG